MGRLTQFALSTVLISACLGPNPNAGGDDDGTSTGTDAETSADGTESGTDDGTDETGADPTCNDGMPNGDETDEDCGGEMCDPCGEGKNCAGPDDCESGVCAGVCAAATCSDGVQNGSEAAEDCGGPCDVCVLDDLHDTWALPDEDLETQPAADMLPDGRFVVAWVTVALDIRYRWFDADGKATSDGLSGSGVTVQEERRPMVRFRNNGMDAELILAYLDTFLMDEGPDVILRRFDDSGAEFGNPVKIDILEQVAVDGFGFDVQGDDAVFAWHGSSELKVRRYDLAGADFLDIQNFDVTANASEEVVSVAFADDGGYLVAWTEDLGDFQFDPYVRRRTSGAAWADDAKAINPDVDGIQRFPSVAKLADDNFIVVWTGATKADPSGGIAGRLLDSNGAATGDELQINSILEGEQEHATVVATGNGFAVAWQDTATDTVRLRRFAADGTPWHDDEAPWGSTADLQPTAPAMAANDDQMVILWAAGDPDTEIVGVLVAP